MKWLHGAGSSSSWLNIIIYNTLLVWCDVNKYFNIATVISVHESRSTRLDQECWTEWTSKDSSNFTHLLVSDSVRQFEQIRADLDISNKKLDQYLKIGHF